MKIKDSEFKSYTLKLGDFIKKSPTAFHAIESIENILSDNGYKRLNEADSWDLKLGAKYYVIRNHSSIIAFDLGKSLKELSFNITASHSDSPLFKVKENALLEVRGKYTQLNTEGYGGMLCAPWLDRPLSLAGRAIVKKTVNKETRFENRLINLDKDMLLIPNMAIHMNRKANEGIEYNKQIDMLPLIGEGSLNKDEFMSMIADSINENKEDILGTELYVYNRMEPSIWGAKEEYFSAPRLDDLQCAYASLYGLLRCKNTKNVNVYACLDNEEVGSSTKQGAASTFLKDVLKRIASNLNFNDEEYLKALAKSFMLSCDNAHAVHPNHPAKTDDKNCVYMNEGVVIKSHAGAKYTTDAVSCAVFKDICQKADVPVQYFSNRSDEVGGSTLGNIATSQVSINCIDIGLPQLAMHSPYETAGVKDTLYMTMAVEEFYRTHFSTQNDDCVIK